MLKEMKTLSILFSEPNVFSVLPEWPDEKHCKEYKCWHNPDRVKQCGCGLYNEYDAACEQSKANAIRIANPEILPLLKRYSDKKSYFKIKEDSEYLKHGDIFQVEGFEYEVNKYCMHDSCSQDGECDYCTNEIVLAKLKLAKEEEPKEQIDQDAWNELGNMINAQSELQDAFGVHPALDICKKYFKSL